MHDISRHLAKRGRGAVCSSQSHARMPVPAPASNCPDYTQRCKRDAQTRSTTTHVLRAARRTVVGSPSRPDWERPGRRPVLSNCEQVVQAQCSSQSGCQSWILRAPLCTAFLGPCILCRPKQSNTCSLRNTRTKETSRSEQSATFPFDLYAVVTLTASRIA